MLIPNEWAFNASLAREHRGIIFSTRASASAAITASGLRGAAALPAPASRRGRVCLCNRV